MIKFKTLRGKCKLNTYNLLSLLQFVNSAIFILVNYKDSGELLYVSNPHYPHNPRNPQVIHLCVCVCVCFKTKLLFNIWIISKNVILSLKL